ncbi:hypothetical protein LCGC14_0793580 [marine sediment metagenome]|uniref:Uncharacterized protein n=1 Tax=marine sediment metagenome TaxID=412755 RepID=A0A0F9PW54_9ZZZZ
MRNFILIFVTLFLMFAFPASAIDFDRPILSGAIRVKMQAAPRAPDALFTTSVGLKIVGTDTVVFCAPAVNGETILGTTDPIVNLGSEVLLEGFAWAGPLCTGSISLVASDRYRVGFAAPGAPLVLVADPGE